MFVVELSTVGRNGIKGY